MNWLLITVNVWYFITLAQSPSYEVTVHQYGFVPSKFIPVTLLTSIFLHANFMHLLGNMWFLHLFGDNVENRCGPFKYLAAYLISGMAGDLSHYIFFSNSDVPTIGASGAIFGVMGMYLFFFPTNRIKVFYFFIIFIGTTAVRALWVIGIWAGMEIIYSQLQTHSGIESGVGHLAHSGGFVSGAVLAALYTGLNLVRNDGRHLLAHLTGQAPASRTREQDETDVADANFKRLDERSRTTVSDPRHDIVALLHSGRIDEARRAWRRYAFDHQDGVLPMREQLEVALALDKNGERGVARDAYERLIASYPNEQPFAAEASLALAGMLLQELKDTGDRQELPLIEQLLQRVIDNHPAPTRRSIALKWLAALDGRPS